MHFDICGVRGRVQARAGNNSENGPPVSAWSVYFLFCFNTLIPFLVQKESCTSHNGASRPSADTVTHKCTSYYTFPFRTKEFRNPDIPQRHSVDGVPRRKTLGPTPSCARLSFFPTSFPTSQSMKPNGEKLFLVFRTTELNQPGGGWQVKGN